jgi:hypothetical protein
LFRKQNHTVQCPRSSRKLRILTDSPVSASFNRSYQSLHEPEVHVGQRLHAREVLGDLPHFQSVHFSTLPAVGETGETALEWGLRRPPRRERSVLAAREDLSRHPGGDDPHPQGPLGYPWFSAFFLPCSQGGRAILNFLLPRNDITPLCSTMNRYSKSPLTIA